MFLREFEADIAAIVEPFMRAIAELAADGQAITHDSVGFAYQLSPNKLAVVVLSDRARTEAPLVLLLSRVAGAAIDASADPEVYKRAA